MANGRQMPMTVRVKICGITSVDDAEAAVEAGADALGLVFYTGSPRCVTLEKAMEISAVLPVSVARVGVFLDAEEEFVREAIDAAGLDTIQLHGAETPEYCARFELVSVWKAFRMVGPESLDALEAYATSAWLLDSYVPGQPGGTGAQFNWELAVAAKELRGRVGWNPTPRSVADGAVGLLTPADQGLDDVRIGEGGGVADLIDLVFGDLAQNAAHDFAGASLGQCRGELDFVRSGDGPDFLADMKDEFLAEFVGFSDALLEGDEGIEALAFDVVRHGGDGGFGDFRMADEGAFDLGGADAMTGDVDDVIDAAHEPVIAVFIDATAVAGEVDVGVHGEVGVDEAVVIAPGGAHHAGPRFLDAEFAAVVGGAWGAIVAKDDRFDAEEGATGAAGFERVGAG
jgi:phosphoribosylanthranilate isomerase